MLGVPRDVAQSMDARLKKIAQKRRENMQISLKLEKRKGTARKRNVLLVLCLSPFLLHPPPDPSASLETPPSLSLSGHQIWEDLSGFPRSTLVLRFNTIPLPPPTTPPRGKPAAVLSQ